MEKYKTESAWQRGNKEVYKSFADEMSSVAPFVPKHPDSYGSHILHQMAEQRENSEFTDFILLSHGHELKCQRNVLAAASPYFSAMFSSGMKEAKEGKALMDTIDFHILKYVVQFMYGKSPSLSWGDVVKLLETCELMHLNELKKQLDVYIADNLTADNCLVWQKNAEKFNLETTEEIARFLMISECENVSKSEDFMKLTYAEVVDYIHTIETSVSHQDQILYAMTRWVSADIDQRKSLMMDALKLVNLTECSAGAINDVTKAQSDLFAEPDVMRLVYHVFLPKLEESERKINPSVLVLGGMAGYDEDCYTECWQWCTDGFANNSWESITNIPEAAVGEQASFVCIPKGFAVLCGSESGTRNAKYDVKDKIWTDLPPTPENLSHTVALCTSGKVHVLDGGHYSNVPTNKMYTLHLTTLKWSRGPDLLGNQYHPIATAYKQSLWVVYNDDEEENDDYDETSPCTFQMLAPDASKWVSKASLPANVKTGGASLVGYKDSLFLLGGIYNVCVQYSIESDQWIEMTSYPSLDHQYGSAFVLNQKIYLCGGGWSCGDVTDYIEEYDPDSDRWEMATIKLPQPMTFFTACCLAGAN